jgi:hypothetical protein
MPLIDVSISNILRIVLMSGFDSHDRLQVLIDNGCSLVIIKGLFFKLLQRERW